MMPPVDDQTLLPSERRLDLQGAVNFRDLGGYQTDDGRRVRWGKVFRSDQLAEVTDQDLQLLAALGLCSLCDLRAESERLHKPNRQLLSSTTYSTEVYELGFMPYQGDALIEAACAGTITVDEIGLKVEEVYRRFVTDQTVAYSKLMALVVNNNLPLLIHCTSGRDRTGFACALILRALGVDQKTIFEDYMLSNMYRRDLTFQMGGNISAEVMAALTQAKAQYLQASFDCIDAAWGSFDNYLVRALSVSEKQRNQLQAVMLTQS